jgi:hypothetical protein
MSAIPTATQMRMRLSLSEKVGTSPWRSFTLKDWHEAKPGIAQFSYKQRVNGLKPATKYRMEVEFIWLDDHDAVVTRDFRHSKICRQRGKLPNLAFRDSVTLEPSATPGTARYVFRIHNNGPAASKRSSLALRVNGAEVDSKPIGRLRSGQRRTVRFVGPVCGSGLQASLDPNDVVREITEDDNVLTAGC